MATAAEREAAFRADFAELLKKHKAEFEVTDDGKPWGWQSGIAEVTLNCEWDESGNITEEYVEFRL